MMILSDDGDDTYIIQYALSLISFIYLFQDFDFEANLTRYVRSVCPIGWMFTKLVVEALTA